MALYNALTADGQSFCTHQIEQKAPLRTSVYLRADTICSALLRYQVDFDVLAFSGHFSLSD